MHPTFHPGMIAPLAAVSIAVGTAAEPPSTAVETCATAECHSSVIGRKLLHGPVAAGDCGVCHVATDVAAHRFELKRTIGELCGGCHVEKADHDGLVVHPPFSEGWCTDCHDPHGSDAKMMLRAGSVASLCGTCHETGITGSYPHAPVLDGDCLACHEAHLSDHAGLLVQAQRDLCLRCHGSVRATLEHARTTDRPSGSNTGEDAAGAGGPLILHGPLAGDCTLCHRPHTAEVPKLLHQPPGALCAGCHTDVFRHASEASHPHGMATEDRACLNCHDGHAGTTRALLHAAPTDLCLGCHGEDITRADGSVLSGLAELTDPDAYRHPPLVETGCRGCHDPHGGDNDFLLTKPFTGTFYQAFDGRAYALCFGCHDAAAFETPQTAELTGFRDGDRNLHYVHVTGPSKGRSCRVCHSAHAASAPKLLRAEVPFGDWKIPIGFVATATGGSCAAGCHRARSYDREKE